MEKHNIPPQVTTAAGISLACALATLRSLYGARLPFNSLSAVRKALKRGFLFLREKVGAPHETENEILSTWYAREITAPMFSLPEGLRRYIKPVAEGAIFRVGLKKTAPETLHPFLSKVVGAAVPSRYVRKAKHGHAFRNSLFYETGREGNTLRHVHKLFSLYVGDIHLRHSLKWNDRNGENPPRHGAKRYVPDFSPWDIVQETAWTITLSLRNGKLNPTVEDAARYGMTVADNLFRSRLHASHRSPESIYSSGLQTEREYMAELFTAPLPMPQPHEDGSKRVYQRSTEYDCTLPRMYAPKGRQDAQTWAVNTPEYHLLLPPVPQE